MGKNSDKKPDASDKSDKSEKTNFKKDVLIPIVTSVAATVITLLLAYAAGQIYNNYFSDEKAIRDLIDREAIYAQGHNVDGVLSLYVDDAIVRDAAGGDRDRETVWRGKGMIEDRYEKLPEFVYLSHKMIDISLCDDGSYARANSDTVGQYKSGDKILSISNDRSEEWVFEKIGGKWKIEYFTYNLPTG